MASSLHADALCVSGMQGLDTVDLIAKREVGEECYSMDEQRPSPIVSAAADSGTADDLHDSPTSIEHDSPADSKSSLIVEFEPPDLTVDVWKEGWRRWSNQRRRAKMAQFIVERLHAGDNAHWIDMTRGKFELNSWPAIAKEWFLQKERGSDPSDATSMLRKGLPRAFPDLREIKEEANKEGTQYLRRVFMAPVDLMNEVVRLATNQEKQEDSASSCDEHTTPRKMSTSLQKSLFKQTPAKGKSTAQGKDGSSAKKRKPSSSVKMDSAPVPLTPPPTSTPASAVSPPAAECAESSVNSPPSSFAAISEGSPGFLSSPPRDSPQLESNGYFSATSMEVQHQSSGNPVIPNALLRSSTPVKDEQSQRFSPDVQMPMDGGVGITNIMDQLDIPSLDECCDIESLLDPQLAGGITADIPDVNVPMDMFPGDGGSGSMQSMASSSTPNDILGYSEFNALGQISSQQLQQQQHHHQQLLQLQRLQQLQQLQQQRQQQLPQPLNQYAPSPTLQLSIYRQMMEEEQRRRLQQQATPELLSHMQSLEQQQQQRPLASRIGAHTAQQLQYPEHFLHHPGRMAAGLGMQRQSMPGLGQPAAKVSSVGPTASPTAMDIAATPQPALSRGLQEDIQFNISPNRSPLQGGGKLFIFSAGSTPLPDQPLTLVFFSPTLQRASTVTTQLTNPFTATGTIPSHAIPETVTVSIALQGETLFQQPFEYFDDNPKLPDDIFRGDLNAVLHRTYDNIGSFLNKAGAAGGASNNGSGSGGNYGNQDLFNQYRQLLMFSIELDIRPLAHLLLQLPAAGPALCQTLSDGKRLEDMAQEYGRRQISSCMSLIRSRYQLKCAGQEEKDEIDPLDLLECSSFVAAECVAYIAKGLAEVKKARLSLSATSGASPDVLSPVAPDEAVCDGNSADDENSEPDLPNKDHKKTKRDVARIASQLESIQLDSSRDKAALQPSSEQHGTSASEATPSSSTSTSTFPVTMGTLTGAGVAAPGIVLTDSAELSEQNRMLQIHILKLQRECDVCHKVLVQLDTKYQQASMQSIGARHAASLLKEMYEQASQRRDTAMKAMILAKKEIRNARRDAEKFESDYIDAMRQRDEALALCDRQNAEIQRISMEGSSIAEAEWKEKVKQLEVEEKTLSEECTRLHDALLQANEARDKAIEERKVVMGGLDAAVKQNDMKTKELLDLQAMHCSMAEELRTTKDRYHDVSEENEARKEALKMARREGESAIKRGIQLQDRLRRVTEGLAPDTQEMVGVPQSEMLQESFVEIQDERDAYLHQLEDLEQQHQDLLSDHSSLTENFTALEAQFTSLSERFRTMDLEVKNERDRRDWAIGEYNKVLAERDQLRTEMDSLRMEKEQAIEDHAKALKQPGDLYTAKGSPTELASSAGAGSDGDTPHHTVLDTEEQGVPLRSHSPHSDRGGGRPPQRRATIYSRRSADDSALGSLILRVLHDVDLHAAWKSAHTLCRDTTTLLSGGGNSQKENAGPVDAKQEVYQTLLLPKGKAKDYGLVLETALFVSGIQSGSLAEKEGKLSCGDLVISVNNVSTVKKMTASEVKKLLKTNVSKQGPLLSCLTQNSEPPSKLVAKTASASDSEDTVTPGIVPKLRAASTSSGRLANLGSASPSPSLSARVAVKIGNISPVVSRLVRTTSHTSTVGSLSASDLLLLGSREYSMREGFEPGKRSRRDSLSSQSSCSYTAASNFAGIYPEDSVSQISQMDAASSRRVTIHMQAGFGVGFKVQGGNRVGLFVTAVRDDSPAHGIIQRGDQLLKAGDHDLRHCSLEKSAEILKTLDGDVTFVVQYNPGKFQFIHEPVFDSFYVRCIFDYARVCDSELSFRRGDILHVINSASSDDSYSAWRVNIDGSETQLGDVPNTQRSLGILEVYIRQLLNAGNDTSCSMSGVKSVNDAESYVSSLKLAPYVHVEHRPALLPRPVLLYGSLSKDVSAALLEKHSARFGRCIAMSSFSTRKEMDRDIASNVLVEYTEDNGHFSSTSVDGVLEVARQNQHCLLSVKPSSVMQLSLANFQPIVIMIHTLKPEEEASADIGQTDIEADISPDVVINAASVAVAIDQVLEQVELHQQQPIWCEVGN